MKNLLAFFLILFVIISCSRPEDTTSQIGEEWVNSKTKVYFIDTLTVKSATFQFDSLDVTSSTRFLAGSYTDAVLGYTESKIFSQFSNTVYDIEDEAVYDSIALILKYDGYFYNDTIPLQQFKVFRITEDIKSDDGRYYNTTDFDVESVPLAIQEFEAEPKKEDSLHISINSTFGSEMFNKLKDNDINNSIEFLDEYKGLSVQPDASNTAILGFTKESFLRIYYHVEEDGEDEEKTLDMVFGSINSFSKTISDRSGTVIEPLVNQEAVLPSSETDNTTFIQAGTGLVMRVDIPYLSRLNDISGEGSIIDASLKFSLKQNSYSSNLFARDSLQAFVVDRKSNVLANLTYDGETHVMSIIENENPEFDVVTYSMDIKNFIDIKLLETNEKYYLVLYPQDFTTSVDRYFFNGEQLQNDVRIKLELTYAVYDE